MGLPSIITILTSLASFFQTSNKLLATVVSAICQGHGVLGTSASTLLDGGC